MQSNEATSSPMSHFGDITHDVLGSQKIVLKEKKILNWKKIFDGKNNLIGKKLDWKKTFSLENMSMGHRT